MRLTLLVLILASFCVAQESGGQNGVSAANPPGTNAAVTVAGSATSDKPNSNDAPRSGNTSAEGSSTALAARAARELHISAGDLLDFKVFGVPELTQEARVSPSGEVTLALVGAVALEGLTVEQAQKKIESVLMDRGFINAPHVTILVKEYATEGVSIFGEVQHPGIFALMGERRLFDAISAAGGMTPRAGRQVTITRRAQPDKAILVELDSDPAKSPAGNVPVFPGDTILVSKAGVVYVMGGVTRPSGFLMDTNDRLTVLQAIALAGGTTSTAALNESRIIRKTPDGIKQTRLPLKSILSAKQQDVPLEANDVLFVPESKTKGAMRRSAEAVLSVATGLAIYRP